MMKRINYKKRAVIHGLSMAVFLGACLGLQANDNEKGASAQATVSADRSTTSSTDRTGDRTYSATSDQNQNGKLSRGDASFVKEASQGGLMEVRMGQTAKDHASNSDVKAYGDMLVKDHSKANDRLSQLASQKGVNLAKDIEPKHTDMIKDMEKKSGADFDRAFIEDAVKDHRKDIAKFERASRDLNDSELKAFATETLPTLRHHLDEAERIAKSLGVNVQARNIDENGNNTAYTSAAGSAGAPGLATSSANSSVNRVDEANPDSSVKTDVNIDKDTSPKADANVEVKTDKGDGKTLGIETQPGDNKTLGVETQKGDNKVLGIKTEPGDGKTLGLNTRKDDGKILGLFPAPGRHKAENRVDVDLDKSDHSVEVNANASPDTSVGAPATSEKGASDTSAKTDTHKDHLGAKTMSYSELPSKVQDTIKTAGGSADTVKNVHKRTEKGQTVYVVKLSNKTVHIAEDGTIVKDTGK
jgi:putative membrane protein